MVIKLTSKNQVTLPKAIVAKLHLRAGAYFQAVLEKNRIELIPVDIVEKKFSDEDFKKMDEITNKEWNQKKPLTKGYIDKIK
jgi:AbrB family looped-hinge helix DNA binding protein